MTEDGWGKSWPEITGSDLVSGDKTVQVGFDNGELIFRELTKEEVLAKWPDTTQIRNYNLDDPIPLEGEPLQPKTPWPTSGTAINQIWQSAQAMERRAGQPELIGWDLGNGADKTILAKVSKTHATFVELYKQGSNLVDDNAYLYFQCEVCQAIFDPVTKSFKTLNDKRHEAGWKVKWNDGGQGYKVYCAKCGE